MDSEQLRVAMGDALLVIDVQNDFLPGGRLAVPRGEEVIGPLNRAVRLFESRRLPVVATRDWHPADHSSFQQQGGPWPPHCVAGTNGASFSPRLELPQNAVVVSKGTATHEDGYSDFDGTGLADDLRGRGVARLFVGGLATEYCVLATVEGARQRGFDVAVLVDAIRPIDVQPGDGERALQRMVQAGAILVEQGDLL
jgi:nicotinamidase/pyrazinamidase